MAEARLIQLDPRWRLLTCAFGLICILLLHTPLCAALACVGSIFLAVWSGLPLAWYGRRYATILPLVVFVGGMIGLASLSESIAGSSSLFTGRLRAMWIFAFKISAIFLFLLILIAAAPFQDTLAAACHLGVPERFVRLARLTHRYTFLLAQEFTRVRTGLKIRGSRRPGLRAGYRPYGHIVGALLVRSYERAVRVGHAMACRGHEHHARFLCEPRTSKYEVRFFFAVCGTAAALLAWDFWQGS